MSNNKNAYLRYQILDNCFSNNYKIYFIEDLLDEVNKVLEDFNGSGSKIKRRQLFAKPLHDSQKKIESNDKGLII